MSRENSEPQEDPVLFPMNVEQSGELEQQEIVAEDRTPRWKKAIGGVAVSVVFLVLVAALMPHIPGSEGARQSAKSEVQRRQELIDVALRAESQQAVETQSERTIEASGSDG